LQYLKPRWVPALVVVAVMAVALSILVSSIASAQAPPQLPCRFHGTVRVGGEEVWEGTTITAKIQGDTYQAVTPSRYGPSTYVIDVAPGEGTTYVQNASVSFWIGPLRASQTGRWEAGGNVELNLTAQGYLPPPATPTPEPTTTPEPTATPVPTATPEPTPTPPRTPTPTPPPTQPPTATPTLAPLPPIGPTPTPVENNVSTAWIAVAGVCGVLLVALLALILRTAQQK